MFEKIISGLIIFFIFVGFYNANNYKNISFKDISYADYKSNDLKTIDDGFVGEVIYDPSKGLYIFNEKNLNEIYNEQINKKEVFIKEKKNIINEDEEIKTIQKNIRYLGDVHINQGLFEYGQTKYYPFHVGVDYKIKYKNLYAFTNNLKVVDIDYNEYLGNYIILEKGSNIYSFQHLKKINDNIKKGSILMKGDLFGISGNSGKNTTGAHLHIEMYHKGQLMSEKVINEEMKCLLLDKECNENGNINYENVSFRQLLKSNNLYKETYNPFFNELERISKEYNFPEKNLLSLKITTGLKFSDIINEFSGNYIKDTNNIRKKSNKKYSLITWYFSCLEAKDLGKINSCNNFSYGLNNYEKMMYDLYDYKLIKKTDQKRYMTYPGKELVINKVLHFFVKENIEGLELKAFPDGNRYSIGIGTKSYKGEVITKEEAYKRAYDFLINGYDENLKGYHENIQVALLSYKFNRGHYPSNWKDYLEKGDLNSLAKSLNNKGISKKIMEKYGKGLNKRRSKERKLILDLIN